MSEYKSNTSEDQIQDFASTQREESSSAFTTGRGWRQRLSAAWASRCRRQEQDSTSDQQPSGHSDPSLIEEQESNAGQGASRVDHAAAYHEEISNRVARSKFTLHPETRESGSADELLSYAVALHTLTIKSHPYPLAFMLLLPIRQKLDSLYGHEDEPGAKETILEQINLMESSSH